MSQEKSLLINYSCRKWGYFSILVGLVFAYINFFTQIRIETPVPAIYSGFMEQSFFTITHTKLTDELAMVFLFVGLLIMIISKEKKETKHVNVLRYKALLLSFILNSILLILCVLFIYGTGFIGVMIGCLFSQAIIYLISFGVLKIKHSE